MARREVRQPDSVVLTVLVSFAGCVVVPAPWSGLGQRVPGPGLLWTGPIPCSVPMGRSSCRWTSCPDWPPQLVRRGAAGLPSFRTALCSRATLCDPGRSPETSPVAVSSVLGSGDATPSPPACCGVSGLDCFSGVRLPLAACELPCVRFQAVVRPSASLAGAWACPSARQHSGLGSWLGFPTQFFRAGALFMFSCCRSCSVLEGFAPSEPPDFHWRTASGLYHHRHRSWRPNPRLPACAATRRVARG